MILEDRSDNDDDDLDLDVGDEVDEGEWLAGLRRAGLPVREGGGVRTLRPLGEPDPAVQDLVDRAYADRTLRGYSADWLRFEAWCEMTDREATSAGPEDVASWVARLVQLGRRPTTIERYLAGVGWGFKQRGLPSPADSPRVRGAVAGARRQLGTAKDRAAPLTLDELRRLIVALPIVTGVPAAKSPRVRRDQTMFALGWAAALRSEELVGLTVDDLDFRGDPEVGGAGGMLVRIRTSKSSPTEPTYVAVPFSNHPSSCPVRLAIRHARDIGTGSLFCHIDRHGHRRQTLQPVAVTRVLQQRLVEVLGYSPDPYSSHSLRAGFVTEARRHRVPDSLIARHTRHKDLRMLGVYDRPVDLLNDPALAGEWW